ncbi:leucine/isoleucine/valine transporter permease subunit [Variovorax sp. SRS16]|uniref:branched-chain amino acid ABC transporter permease n=1 Tax=Variovorax sp. SRS16 TaxID=282217 RepID=UPI0013192278|nr:branched-chain amino acid ABC transporter permease [Variovorax sp. SRS16]VTU22679.1 leucine/isoleucine/valine transporter permease subunit [Variovorax sp. SRS16]
MSAALPTSHTSAPRGSRAAIGWCAAALVFALLPLVLGESYVFLTVDFFIMSLFAMSYNLLLGQGGMLSFGHATYYGLGAYAVAILQNKYGVPPWLGLAAAPVVAALGAFAIGWLSVRVTGMYFAMLTLAFGQLVFTLVLGWYSFTGGDDGLPVALPDWMLSARNYYYFSLVVVALCIWLIHRITHSPFGIALGAIRDNRQRAAYIGLDVRRLELRVFVVAGAFAGIAGGLRAPLQQMAFPSLLGWSQSADPVLMALAGGIHNFVGPIVGAALFVFTNFAVTSRFEYPLLVFGTLVLLIVLFLPNGIVGSLARKRRAVTEHRP